MSRAEDEIADLLKGARRDERPPERVWEALARRLDAETVPAAVSAATATAEPLLQLACASCAGGLTEGSAVHCASCLAPHHAECFTACAVHGCGGTRGTGRRAGARSPRIR